MRGDGDDTRRLRPSFKNGALIRCIIGEARSRLLVHLARAVDQVLLELTVILPREVDIKTGNVVHE